MKFIHPLARSAKVWPAYLPDGAVQKVLTIVTTLELDPEHKKFKAEQVDRLRTAAQGFVGENPSKADSFLIMNKPKD